MPAMPVIKSDNLIIGAGPIGLEVAVAFKKAGLEYLHLDAGQIGQIIADFPPQTQFFSSNDRIALAGIPIPSVTQARSRREAYLAYLRSVADHYQLKINTYERVLDLRTVPGGFEAWTRRRNGLEFQYRTRRVILCTGGTANVRTLGISGEDLPHVTHNLGDIHQYWRRKVLIIGGKNSAVEAAIRCYHVGAEITVSYRKAEFPPRVKYWLLPEMDMLLRTGRVQAHFETVPLRITPTDVTLEHTGTGETFGVEADHVLLMIGYEADMTLFRMLGVTLTGENEAPVHDEATMETDVPGVYVAGTATVGTQPRFMVYIENSHIHGERIVSHIRGEAPPPPPRPIVQAES